LTTRLLWKLLLINILVILFVILMVWLSVDYLAADYFVKLMERYHISPEPAHDMFVSAIHRYLIWASLAALLLAALLSFLMMRRTLTPLSRMIQATREIAEGDYAAVITVQTRDEIGQLAVAFNRMAASLKNIERLRKQLMVDVAHELRTPLTNIQGYLEGLIDGVVAPSKENFDLLHEETMRLTLLVEDILKLARADAARTDLQRQHFNITDAIRKHYLSFKKSFMDKDIHVKIESDAHDGVWADSEKISRVLKNLLQNAFQYTPREGRVFIEVRRVSGNINIAFTNPAPEVSSVDVPFLFERFYRGEKSRSRDYGGAGIGLAIVKELVEAHGGSVGAELVDGLIRIWFELPVDPPQETV
jgi:two-component system, OmpR family, sensor histidine kinase BaeS